MMRFVAMRLVRAVLVVWVALTLVFVLTHVVGDPAVATLGPRARPEQLEAFREAHGLNRPLHVQYVDIMSGLVTGDLASYRGTHQRVGDVVMTRLPRTMLLGALTLVLELLLGVGIGILAALRRNTLLDTLLMGGAFLGISAPSFLTGLVFLNILAFRLGWFPVGGYGVSALDHLRHAMLPAFTLAILGAASYARIMRSEMIETLRQDHVRTATAKGLPRWRVVMTHAVRNALLPIVTLAGLGLPLLVSGAIVTEQIYNWPGVGRLAWESISTLDVPMLLAVVFWASVAVQVGNLLADIAVARLDPRVRLGDEPRR